MTCSFILINGCAHRICVRIDFSYFFFSRNRNALPHWSFGFTMANTHTRMKTGYTAIQTDFGVKRNAWMRMNCASLKDRIALKFEWEWERDGEWECIFWAVFWLMDTFEILVINITLSHPIYGCLQNISSHHSRCVSLQHSSIPSSVATSHINFSV